MLAEVGVGGAGVSVMTGNPGVGVEEGASVVEVSAMGLRVAVGVGGAVGMGGAAGWEHATVTKRSSASRRTIRLQEQLSVALFALLQYTAQLLNLAVEFALSPGHVEGVSKERQPGDCIDGK